MWSTNYSLLILVKVEFSRQISEKSPNNKFHENAPSGKPDVPSGRRKRERERRSKRQTGRHDESNARCSRFCERP